MDAAEISRSLKNLVQKRSRICAKGGANLCKSARRAIRTGVVLSAIYKQLDVGPDVGEYLDGKAYDKSLAQALMIRLRAMQRLGEDSREVVGQINEYVQMSKAEREELDRMKGH